MLFFKVSPQFVQHIVQQMPPGTVHQVVKMPGHMVSSGQPINQVPGQQVHIDTYKVYRKNILDNWKYFFDKGIRQDAKY